MAWCQDNGSSGFPTMIWGGGTHGGTSEGGRVASGPGSQGTEPRRPRGFKTENRRRQVIRWTKPGLKRRLWTAKGPSTPGPATILQRVSNLRPLIASILCWKLGRSSGIAGSSTAVRSLSLARSAMRRTRTQTSRPPMPLSIRRPASPPRVRQEEARLGVAPTKLRLASSSRDTGGGRLFRRSMNESAWWLRQVVVLRQERTEGAEISRHFGVSQGLMYGSSCRYIPSCCEPPKDGLVKNADRMTSPLLTSTYPVFLLRPKECIGERNRSRSTYRLRSTRMRCI